MTSQGREELIASLMAWGTLALFCTLLAVVVWFVRLRAHRRLSSPAYFFLAPWTGPEVLAAFLLYLLLGSLGQAIGGALVGPTSDRPVAASIPANVKPAQILGDAIAFPLQLAGIPLLLFAVSKTRPADLGLTWRDGWWGVFYACCMWLAATPIILGVNGLAGYLYEMLSGSKPDEHPFIELALSGPPWLELLGMVGLAVVKAPLMEELLFRGILQRWLAKSAWHCHLVYALAIVAPAYLDPRNPRIWWTVAFVLSILPIYLALLYAGRLSPYRNHYQSILVSSVLFAAVHGSVWPTPVALFPLGLCLGYLAFRTGRLVAPVTLHALFNAVACLTVLYLPAIERKGETTAAYISSPSCTVIDWPACAKPRLTYPRAITDSDEGAQRADVSRPISVWPEKSLHAGPGTRAPATVKRTRHRLTCPYARMRAIVSWPM
jgi:membrane protease YdiL (CAAX protease family)